MNNTKDFWASVKKTESCWIWMGAQNKFGYGYFYFGGKRNYAHRFSYGLKNITKSKPHILHRCDNPSCVNPDHLFAGTQSDNNEDRDQKNRHAFGERNGVSKLTVKQVIEIRKKYGIKKERHFDIGIKYGVSQSAITHVLNRRTWKQLDAAKENKV